MQAKIGKMVLEISDGALNKAEWVSLNVLNAVALYIMDNKENIEFWIKIAVAATVVGFNIWRVIQITVSNKKTTLEKEKLELEIEEMKKKLKDSNNGKD